MIEADEVDGTTTGVLENVLTATGLLDTGRIFTELHLPDGRVARVLTATLLRGIAKEQVGAAPDELMVGEVRSIPVIEEQIEIAKRTVTTGKVQIEKHIEEYAEALDVPLAVRSFDVERVVLNQPVDAAPAVRQEGDTTIYSLVEEQVVVTTQLILKEELRVTQRDTERRDTRTVTLRREVMSVTREGAVDETN